MKRRLSYAGAAALLCAGAAYALLGAPWTTSASKVAAETSTPRLSNGKPDLSGMWVNVDRRDSYAIPIEGAVHVHGAENGNRVNVDERNLVGATGDEEGVILPTRRCAPNQTGCRDNRNQATDYEFTTRLDPNRPLYKPEFWTNVQDLDYNTNFADPIITHACYPRGVPRMGPPRKILHTVDEVVFLYGDEVRVIPTDGRTHDPNALPTYRGDAVGHWEEDTLVVDVRSFNDSTWLAGGLAGGGGGYFHSYEMRVIERLRRDGNTLHYQAIVEDPEVLLEPWAMNPVVMRLNSNPRATFGENSPCDNTYDRDTIVDRVRH